jgi:hypothetical protein
MSFSIFFFLSFILSFLHYLHVYTLFAPLPAYSQPPTLVLLKKRHKKDIAFLLLWDKDSYTERFLVLQTTLVQYFQTSLLLLGPLPIVASASLNLPYLLLYSEHINHIEVLGFLPFPYSSHACSPLSVWSMSNNITAFVLGL